jgi:hypothetical protein
VGQAGVDGGEVLAELDEQRFRFGIDVLIAGLRQSTGAPGGRVRTADTRFGPVIAPRIGPSARADEDLRWRV